MVTYGYDNIQCREDDRSGPYSMRNDTLAMSLSRSMEASLSLMSRSQRHAIPGVDDGQGSNRYVEKCKRKMRLHYGGKQTRLWSRSLSKPAALK